VESFEFKTKGGNMKLTCRGKEHTMSKIFRTLIWFVLVTLSISLLLWESASACTTIGLVAKDGAVVCGRTMEWGTFDLNSRVTIVPQGHVFVSQTPDGKEGFTWQTRYGVVGLDVMERDALYDGINEEGMYVTALYHAGFAVYPTYNPDQSNISMGPNDLTNYVLTQFSTVDEVREGLKKVRVVAIPEAAIGNIAPPVHLMVVDQTGKAIVVEFLNGVLAVFDNPLRVMTNAPSFDWHMTNLRNYVQLSPNPHPAKNISGLSFAPLGAGSGLLGIPGDYTPPSRFVRAVTYTQMARTTPDGAETVYEVFRILDSFNLPLGSAEGADDRLHPTLGVNNSELLKGMRSSTIWTTAADTRNLVYYYHTQHNRRVRMVDMKRIDFSPSEAGIIHIPLDKQKSQDYEDLTPEVNKTKAMQVG
jgi:choloylglycine hydrolase